MKYPNLFIVGAAKAGTTSLRNYLNQHPDIYMTPIKEPNYFGQDIQWGKFERSYQENTMLDLVQYFNHKPLRELHIAYVENKNDYLALFQDVRQHKILGDASSSYLYSEQAAREIYEFNPEAKIIIILRDPVERTLSHYFMDLSVGRQKDKNIISALNDDFQAEKKGWGISHLYIDLSLYYEQIKRYIDIFPRKQILIIQYQDLVNNASAVLGKAFSFLNIPDVLYPVTQEIHNQTLIPKNSMVYHFKGLKRIIPPNILRFVKRNTVKLLYQTRKDMPVTEVEKSYIESLVVADWIKTNTTYSDYILNIYN